MKFHDNNMKVLISIILLILLLIPLSFAATGSYSLPSAEEYILVEDDGTTVITEEITYSIFGTVNGVTRIVPLSGQQTLTDITVETPGYYNTLELENNNNQVTLKVWLYKDQSKTEKVFDEDVKIIYHYSMLKGVKIYNDVAELQYMSWGNGWNQPINSLITHIQLPGNKDDVKFWSNPETYLESNAWTSDNELTTVYGNIPEKTIVEQRLLMPKSYFKSTTNADVINKDAEAKIISDQLEYSSKQEINNLIWSIPAFVSAILLILPVGMYLKWGRNPKIVYNADYESQVPTDDSPVFINAMINGIVEQVNEDAFTATLLDLINRKYYKILTSNEEDTILRQYDKDTTNLKLHEIDIINFLQQFANDKNQISLKDIGEDSYTVQQFVHAWKIDAYHDVPRTRVNQYFNKSKENIMSGYNILAIFLAIVFILALIMFGSGPMVTIGIILAVIVILEQLIIFFFVDTPLGTWTREGKEFHDKWKNFEKYIRDFSLIKERPPESIKIWGKFLVYATALGCAEEVSKNMKKYIEFNNIPEAVLYDSDLVSLGYLGGLYNIHHTFYPNITDSNFGNSGFDTGSFGDIGGPGSGGFGGGGGGVF